MAAEWVLDGDQVLGYALLSGLHINTCFCCSSVFRIHCLQSTLKLRFINQSEKPRKIVHLCPDICVWLRVKVVGHPPDMRLKVQSRVEGLCDLQDMESLVKHGLIPSMPV